MVAKCVSKYIRISPFKIRRIANEVRGMNVPTAEAYLSVLTNKGAFALKKAIHSARSNLLFLNKGVDEEEIVISKILVDGGPTLKRYHPISKGRAGKILKRTSHITVEVSVK
ncbi:MAG: 50S ribosomal protein L22 [Treponema sp.]|jgi:large subunit ribosomal protein L22|nr:50S ribosomal protein L22 [Treponema sp.]